MDFDEAISSHAQWKLELGNCLTNGSCNLKPAEIGMDTRCPLGKGFMAKDQGTLGCRSIRSSGASMPASIRLLRRLYAGPIPASTSRLVQRVSSTTRRRQ